MDVNIEKLKKQYIRNKQIIEALKIENKLIASFLDLFEIKTEEFIKNGKQKNRQYGRKKAGKEAKTKS